MTKELTAENKLELISLINNGVVNTKLTKSVMQEVTNLQHCMINNIINSKVRNTNDLNDLCYMFDRICSVLEQPRSYFANNYRLIFSDNYFKTAGVPDKARVRLIEEQNNLYCDVVMLNEDEQWEISQCLRVLINLMQFWKPE